MFDVGIIQWLQTFSSPLLDGFFLVITALGSHYTYMLILPFVYWAVDRKVGRRLAGLFLGSMWLNGLLKEFLTLPRPSPEAVRVLVGEPSPGFPSGHAQGAITLWGYLAISLKRRWLTILSIALIVLIPLSRLYLGAHFLGDVLGGLAIGGLLVAFLVWYTGRRPESKLSIRMRMLLTFVIPLLLYPLYQTGTSEQLIGFFIGFLTADLLTGKVVPFPERISPGKQIAKLLIGYVGFAVLVVLHRLLLPIGLPSVFGYSIIGIWIALGAPALFQRLGLAGGAQTDVDATTKGYLRHYLATAGAILVLVVASAIYVNVAVPVVAQPTFAPSDGLLIIGHRGAAGLAPENTLAAFEAALEHGAQVLEMDVRRTRDGAVVVLHDSRVDRTTNGSGSVSGMTLAQLQALDAGYRFTPDGGETYPYRGKGVTVPTLEQVVKAFPDTYLLIELKENDPSLADAVISVLQSAHATSRVMLSSFHDAVVERVRELAPEIPTGYSQEEVVHLVIMQRLGLGAFAKPTGHALQVPEWQGPLRVVDPGLTRLGRRKGLQVHVWTVNDEESMSRLIALDVDGIITDYPDRLQRVLSVLEGRDMNRTFY